MISYVHENNKHRQAVFLNVLLMRLNSLRMQNWFWWLIKDKSKFSEWRHVASPLSMKSNLSKFVTRILFFKGATKISVIIKDIGRAIKQIFIFYKIWDSTITIVNRIYIYHFSSFLSLETLFIDFMKKLLDSFAWISFTI